MTKTYLKNLQIRKAPRLVEKVVHALINIRPDLSEELLQCVDIPLKVKADTISGGEFIICDFNRDGDSYRSPQSNEYFPPPTDFKPFAISERMRSMEKAANQLFDVYRKLYFSGGVSSVYFWDLEDDDFASCWLIHKGFSDQYELDSGYWDSIHVFEAKNKGKGQWEYRITTTVIVHIEQSGESLGSASISGQKSKQFARRMDAATEQEHLANMGQMIEDGELELRNTIQAVYIQKTRQVVGGIVKDLDHSIGSKMIAK